MIQIVLHGYEHQRDNGKNILVAAPLASAVRSITQTQTLYEYAEHVEGALAFQGRAAVYVIPLGPDGLQVAVRHVMRGGLIGRFIRDRFLPPTRVLRELFTSVRLRMAGVPTPEIVAVATYPASTFTRTADVLTRYIPDSADLAAVFNDSRNDTQRRAILDAIVELLHRLKIAGAHHPDLNLRNILITPMEEGYVACMLDIDRVNFHSPGDPMVARANINRLTHSLRKWRARPGARADALPDADIEYLTSALATLPA